MIKIRKEKYGCVFLYIKFNPKGSYYNFLSYSRMPKKSRKINIKGGGIWDSLSDAWNSLTYSVKDGANTVIDKTKEFGSELSNDARNIAGNVVSGANDVVSSAKSMGSSALSSAESGASSVVSSIESGVANVENDIGITGGKKGRRTRSKRGGYKDSYSTTNLAFSAAPYKGTQTAQTHQWVGGKSKRRKNRKHGKKSNRRYKK